MVNLSRAHMRQHWRDSTVAVIVLLVTLSGCTGDQERREYSVPNSACGTSINAKEFSGFFPHGKKLTIRMTTNSRAILKCAISVDGKLIVQTSQEWWNDMSALEFARGMTLDDPDHQTGNGTYAYSGYQAFSKVTGCRNSKHKDQVLFTAVQAVGSKHRDAAAMMKIITDYTKAVGGSDQCE